MDKKVLIIGAGFGGLSAACYLAKAGYKVHVIEKNDQPGGRAMVMEHDGFRFDLGPSWYMMPDVFEEFFADFGKKPTDFFELHKLDPSYKVFTAKDSFNVHDAPRVFEIFEAKEPGSSVRLKRFLAQTKKEYEMVRRDLLSRPMLSALSTINTTSTKLLSSPALIGSYHERVKRVVSNPDLQKVLEFMVVFMGGSPKNIPGLYSLLAHVDLNLGIWYPTGGIGSLARAMYELALSLGVSFSFNSPVTSIIVKKGVAVGVSTKTDQFSADVVLANADYHFVEQELLEKNYRTQKWGRKVLSPSGLLVYLGVNKKIDALEHHNLFFDSDWDVHFDEVFNKKVWSKEPLFYVGAPSRTDKSVSPKGMENLFILAPMANNLSPTKKQMEETADRLIRRMERATGDSIMKNIIFRNVQAHDYFRSTFNAYQGNAFGLAHTLSQSAFFRPPMQHKKLSNLFFVGQYTNPGTGVPIVTLSGKVVSELITGVQ